MPFFSIVIPTYNRQHLLAKTLESVWKQSFRDFEVVIVDDGSTDGTIEYLHSLEQPITVLSTSRRGPSFARNLGASRASGDYLAFLDSDDLWFPWTLQCFADALTHPSRPSLVSSSLVSFENESEIQHIGPPFSLSLQQFPDTLSASIAGRYIGAGMLVCKKSTFEEIGGFEENIRVGEDHDFMLRAAKAGPTVSIEEPATLAWRRHPGSTSSEPNRLYEGMLFLLDRHRNGTYEAESRKRELAKVMSMHLTPSILSILAAGHGKKSLMLFKESLKLLIAARRWKFLFGYPFHFLLKWHSCSQPH